MEQLDQRFIHYVILLTKVPGRSFTEALIRDHVRHLKELDEKGQLVLCGPFRDYQGGMVIIRANSLEEARDIALQDPFVSSGAESFEIRTLEVSCAENNHHGMG